MFTVSFQQFKYVRYKKTPCVILYRLSVWQKKRLAPEYTMSEVHAKALFKSLKPLLYEKLLWFGYYDGEPISFFLMIPEINHIIKHLKGKLNWIHKLRFAYSKDLKKIVTKATGLLFGVIPEHQGKGVEAAMIMAFAKLALSVNFRYIELEMHWIGDFNLPMMKVLEQIGVTIRKTYVTYRYLFDPSIVFQRASLIND